HQALRIAGFRQSGCPQGLLPSGWRPRRRAGLQARPRQSLTATAALVTHALPLPAVHVYGRAMHAIARPEQQPALLATARTLLIMLVAADLAFIVLHVIYVETSLLRGR